MSCVICYLVGVTFLLGIILKLYIKFATKWCRSKTCLSGKTVIITGANTGIGYETALDLACRGARVILACRDQKRAEEARYKITEETGNQNVIVKILDLASFESVRAFAKEINSTEERLDLLINNAGIGGEFGDVKSKDGHVFLMQVNYYSSFLLTNLLIDLLKKSGPSRIVNVSSVAANWTKNFDVDKIDVYPGDAQVYFDSKLSLILFTRELAKRLKGSQVTAYSLHPGAVRTEIYKNISGFVKFCFFVAGKLFFKSPEEGAQTTIYTAVAPGIEDLNGEHFEECARVEPYKTVLPGLEKKLWEKTIDVIKMKPEEIKI